MVGRGSNSASARGGDSMTEEQKRERRREQKRRSSAKGRERLKTIEGTKKYKKMEAAGRKIAAVTVIDGGVVCVLC